jgi:formamidopyrimidine-DNA glycosylase
MPESPEVQALVDQLGARLTGHVLRDVDVLEFRVVKTRTSPPADLVGDAVTGAARHGKHVEISFGDRRLIISLGRHGWARILEPGEEAPRDGPPALAGLVFDDGARIELTDAGGWVSLGMSVVGSADEVPAIAKLGPDPLDPAFSRADFDRAFGGRRKQVKAILQEQESLAGIGNAYSDEILHAAKISPVVHAAALSSAQRDELFAATVRVMRDAAAAQAGVPADRLKQAKIDAMLVHGRAGEPCPVCGGDVRDFSFASTTAQYCPTCQTDGVIL